MPQAKTEELPASARSDVVDQAYSEEFLRDLGAQFHFDALSEKIAKEIRIIGRCYLTELIAFDDGQMRTVERKRYQQLKRQVGKFEELLNEPRFVDIESDMYWAAHRTGEPAPQTDFPELTEFEKMRGAPYLAEFKRLLRILDKAADDGTQAFAPRRGRKRNEALDNFARRCAFLWEHMLKRRFSVDYHKGSALTEAGQFVKAMLNRLDPAIRDPSIITAMRTYIAWKNDLDARRSRGR